MKATTESTCEPRPGSPVIRELTHRHEFQRVVQLEQVIWGLPTGDDTVPLPLLIVSVRRGAILLGAFDGPALVGFVYSIPGIRNGRLTQWSHMLGVLPQYRRGGLGFRLKLAQRQRALDQGADLVEWTYDPLLALNAQLNIVKLGAVVEEYEENVYGPSVSPLHGGVPTDRFVAQWWVRSRRVEDRLAGRRGNTALRGEAVNTLHQSGRWLHSSEPDLTLEGPHLLVQIPTHFDQLLSAEPRLAAEWRRQTRAIFTSYFARGYRVVDFALDAGAGRGVYTLGREIET